MGKGSAAKLPAGILRRAEAKRGGESWGPGAGDGGEQVRTRARGPARQPGRAKVEKPPLPRVWDAVWEDKESGGAMWPMAADRTAIWQRQ